MSKYFDSIVIGVGPEADKIVKLLAKAGHKFDPSIDLESGEVRLNIFEPREFFQEKIKETVFKIEAQEVFDMPFATGQNFGPSRHRNGKYNNVAKNRAKNKNARKQRRRARK